MNSPLFKVGELVGLVSQECPHLNGQYHIRAIVYGGDVYLDKFLGNVLWKCTDANPDEPAYLLDELGEHDPDGSEYKWDESSLRKIHKPSQYSFNQLLTELKIQIKLHLVFKLCSAVTRASSPSQYVWIG